MKQYRILEVSPFPPELGGVSVSVQRLYERLQNEPDLEVHKYSLNAFCPRFFSHKIGIFLKFVWLFIYVLFSRRFDLVHFHVSGVSRRRLISLIFPAVSPRSKMVFTVHGDMNDVLEEDPELKEFNTADSIIVVKSGDSKLFPQSFNGRVYEIPAFIFPDTSKPLSLPNELREFLVNDKPIILMCGSIVVSEQYNDLYGFGDCVELYNSLKANGIDVKMLMVCTGYKYEYEKKYHDGILNRIKHDKDIMLYDSKMEFWPILNKCDIFVRPTKTDGDALSIREALYMKKVVVTSDVVKRPDDVILYSDQNDLLQKILDCLGGIEGHKKQIGTQFDFYYEIVNVYHNTLK